MSGAPRPNCNEIAGASARAATKAGAPALADVFSLNWPGVASARPFLGSQSDPSGERAIAHFYDGAPL